MTENMIGLVADLKESKKLIAREIVLLLNSINKKIDKDVKIKEKILKVTESGWGIIPQNTISYECRNSDYGHDQYSLAIRENCKLEVCIMGCGNSEVDLCETDSCIEEALETANIENIKDCFEFLLLVDSNLNELYIG